eukprot:14119.XXX_205273_204931_1 [CDS] Oithona nana genome sequencing.
MGCSHTSRNWKCSRGYLVCRCSKCRGCRCSRHNCSSCRNRSGSLGWSNLISSKCISGHFRSCNAPNDSISWHHFDIGNYYYDYSDTYLNSD